MPSEQPLRNREVLTLTLGCMSVAVAAWLVPASVYVVDWNGDTARRVAMLAPFSRLLVLFLVAGIVVLGLVASLPVTSRRQLGHALPPLFLPSSSLGGTLSSRPPRPLFVDANARWAAPVACCRPCALRVPRRSSS